MTDIKADLDGLLKAAREAKSKMQTAINEHDYPFAAGRGLAFIDHAFMVLKHSIQAGSEKK